MRVILTANFSPWSAYSGGGQRSTHELACALSDRGHHVSVVFTRPPWERVEVPSGLPYALRWAGFFGLRSRSGAPLRSLNALTVARAVDELVAGGSGPVVVHAQGEEGALLPRLARRHRFGLVVTPRYPSFPSALARHGGALDGLRRLAVPPKYLVLGAALRGAHRWCPTSESAAREVAQCYGLPRSRCTVVPNGIASAFARAERTDRATEGPIVFFGRLAPAKGVDLLLESVATLDDPPAVSVIGRGPAREPLERRARELGLGDRVRFVGWQGPEQLASTLAGARMAVLPSREESFGNAMAEAMAAGTPLISTRVGSVPEVVEDGRTGVLVAPDDIRALARAMRAWLDDPAAAEAMGARGRARVRERFSWDASARAYEGVYDDAWDAVAP